MEIKLPKLKKIDSTTPKVKKKKILLLSDDLRLPSGIGTISKEIVLNTVKQYDWIQLGAALKHPEHGKGIDISHEIAKETGISDADVKVIPWTGYGDRNILFSILNQEKPDAIFHFTDPRYWGWLYQLEHEIKITYGTPIIYYSIWDDLPYPMWNAPFYGSCDLIMGISKQSDNIHREVLKQNGFEVINYNNKKERDHFKYSNSVVTGYVPHGLNHNIYKPLNTDNNLYKKLLKQIKQDNHVDFIFMWNNRNIRRKQPGDVILSFKTFIDKLPKKDQQRVALLMHTTSVDSNGTDLRAVHENIAPNCKILFSQNKLSTEELNAMYNISDVVINIASNEGWGLSSTEALLSGTPIINNVTGGLQDQCGFLDDNGNWLRFNGEFSSNHLGKYKNHGRWVEPVFPSNRSMQGSPSTPYIFDDRVKFEDVANAMMKWWETPENVRKECGLSGRSFCLENGLTSQQMGNKMIEMIEFLFEMPKQPKLRYTLNKVTPKQYKNIGIV